MDMYTLLRKWSVIIMAAFMLLNCGGGGSAGGNGSGDDTGTTPDENSSINTHDEFSQVKYRGLTFYHKNMGASSYTLNQLTDAEFDVLSKSKKLTIANKLLNTLFYGYPLKELKKKSAEDGFLGTVRSGLEEESTDKGWLEEHILDDTVFRQYDSSWYTPQAIAILTRFYAMKDLDKYFLNNWVAYILTQTIMFSPAYELSSTHTPDVSGIYNRLVTMLENESGMRFIAYVHMMSGNNWRRFRSPEDNGREMLEIFLLDTNDAHVPIAGRALKNWKLNTDSDILEVSLNQNTTPLNVLTNFFGGEAVITGEDFYRELAKSDRFTSGVTHRLVDFFFPEKSTEKKEEITNAIISSHPETWQDILLQIIFSEEYLLHNNRGQSAEETFYSLAKKMDYRHRRSTFREFKSRLEEMHQASMKYKLGKLERVPLDSLSFAHYHKYIREEILLDNARPEYDDKPDSWGHDGWMPSFIAFDRFDSNSSSDTSSLKTFVDYLFESTIARKATDAEHTLFKNHMIELRDGKQLFKDDFNMFVSHDDPEDQADRRERNKRNIAHLVLDYISRLDAIYRQREVK